MKKLTLITLLLASIIQNAYAYIIPAPYDNPFEHYLEMGLFNRVLGAWEANIKESLIIEVINENPIKIPNAVISIYASHENYQLKKADQVIELQAIPKNSSVFVSHELNKSLQGADLIVEISPYKGYEKVYPDFYQGTSLTINPNASQSGDTPYMYGFENSDYAIISATKNPKLTTEDKTCKNEDMLDKILVKTGFQSLCVSASFNPQITRISQASSTQEVVDISDYLDSQADRMPNCYPILFDIYGGAHAPTGANQGMFFKNADSLYHMVYRLNNGHGNEGFGVRKINLSNRFFYYDGHWREIFPGSGIVCN
jgi:hypothetical protein